MVNVLDEFVEVKWHASNKAHYENLGYVFTKFKDVLKVRLEHLSNKSNSRVSIKCGTCGNVYSLVWARYVEKKNKHECRGCYGFATKTYVFIHREFNKRGYDLLSTCYTNSHQHLDYRCRKHPGYTQKITYKLLQSGCGCRYCGRESGVSKRRITEKTIFKLLADLNYKFYEFVLDGKHVSSKTHIKYVCPNHPFDVQVTNYDRLQQGHRCPMCFVDNQRFNFSPSKNTSISDYFRRYLIEWRELTENLCNYKCILTGERKYAVHHHVPFDKILKEALANVNLPKHKCAKHYTESELTAIIAELRRLHEVYGPGVCLADVLHKKLHSKYGSRKQITKEQFEEFCNLYYAGKILEKNKHLNFD